MGLQNLARLSVLAFIAAAVAGVLLRPLTPPDEARYMAVAWEMYQSENYFVPTKNLELYTDKPPLLFWTINLVWSLLGVSEIAARLVGPFYALVALVLTGLLAKRIWPDDTEIHARALLVLSSLLIFSVLGGLTMFDAMLTVAVLIGLHALVLWVDTGALRWWVMFGFALALGVVAKGPVIFFHLAPAMLTIPFWANAQTPIGCRRALSGAGLALLAALGLVGLWVVPAALIGGQEYRDAILWTQTAGRINESFAHSRPWWYFVMLLPVLLFPWIWLPEFWRRLKTIGQRDNGMRLCLIWFGAAFLLFSLISGKQPHYLLPELPAFALIVAWLIRGKTEIRLTLATVPVFVIAVIAAAAAIGVVPLGELATLLTPTSVLLAWALAVMALCLVCVKIGGLPGASVLSLGLVLSMNMLIGFTDTRSIYNTNSLARLVKPYEKQGIAFFGQFFHAEFNFTAGLTAPVATPATPEDLKNWALGHTDGVIVGRVDRADIPWQPHQTVLFRNATYAIWRVSDATYPELES